MTEQNVPWDGDLLGFAEFGATFTKLVQSFDGTKVISIEAGFGHGKTFFRTNWAAQLRQAGEVVVEIDAQQSDHSGEPVITFLGALIAAAPEEEQSKLANITQKGGKLAWAMTKVAIGVFARHGLKEVVEAGSDLLKGHAGGIKPLEDMIAATGEELSKVAGQMIVSQLAAERARTEELPAQIDALRDALTKGRERKRVVILIDELDRCHPDYAIALLEAMKLVFGRPGFVFCLMVNADYLESIAHHRFGTKDAGEKYLDKFVDLRLRLTAREDAVKVATRGLAMALPLRIAFGEDPAFSVEAAAELAGTMAAASGLSFRQIKRVLDRVQMVLRCYRDRPVDCALLVYLAFEAVAGTEAVRLAFIPMLARAQLTPAKAEYLISTINRDNPRTEPSRDIYEFIKSDGGGGSILLTLPEDRYALKDPGHGRSRNDWQKVLFGLGPRYIPEHQDMLDAVHRLMVSD